MCNLAAKSNQMGDVIIATTRKDEDGGDIHDICTLPVVTEIHFVTRLHQWTYMDKPNSASSLPSLTPNIICAVNDAQLSVNFANVSEHSLSGTSM